jgi:hypothetical protein
MKSLLVQADRLTRSAIRAGRSRWGDEDRSGCAESTTCDEVVGAIRRAMAREHKLALQRVIPLRPGGLPKTPSGEERQASCRDELPLTSLTRRTSLTG